jgi:hypothetical protein
MKADREEVQVVLVKLFSTLEGTRTVYEKAVQAGLKLAIPTHFAVTAVERARDFQHALLERNTVQ